MLKLYYSPGACALGSHIALEESGADFELSRVDLRQGEQKTPEYLAVNPVGSTPALVTDEGILTENLVIMGYIAQTHPEAKLADVKSSFWFGKMQAFNGYLASSLHPAVGKALFARPPLEGEARDAAIEFAMSKYRMVEDTLFKGPWAMGDNYTVADGYLLVFTRWAKQAGLLDPARFPKLNDHLTRMQARPAVQRAMTTEGIPAL
jgi:glutathione S-transferase